MNVVRESRALSQIEADVLIVFILHAKSSASAQLRRVDPSIDASLLELIENECTSERFVGKAGQSVLLQTHGKIKAPRLVLRGMGKAEELTASTVRKGLAATARRLGTLTQLKSAAVAMMFGANAAFIQAYVEGWLLGSYRFTKYKTSREDAAPNDLDSLFIWSDPSDADAETFDAAARRGESIANATRFARDMVAEPAAYMTPTRLSQIAASLVCDCVSCEVMDAAQIQDKGMGALLGVARGSNEQPRFIVLRYSHPEAQKTIALAGKGITFDSGGLSIKNAQSMEHMKYDMTGAAAVIATTRAMAELKPKINVVAVAAACENMPSGTALHPGDILKAMNGKTIEVNNTDAEGRLVLADALCYLQAEKPAEIIDVATLTGAVVAALGRAAAGIMGNDAALIERLRHSADEAGERFWQLPLYEEYQEALKSDVADLKNAGARGEAGSAAAAMFLKEFVNGTPWAHLDIAGPAWMEKEKDELNKGGTAFAVRTLCYYLLSQAQK